MPSSTLAATPVPTTPLDKTRTRRWLRLAALAFLGLFLSYGLFVLTPHGQALENAALRGADQVFASELTKTRARLAQITLPFLGFSTLLLTLLGLWRRRWDVAVSGLSVFISAVGLAEVLKYLLPRPHLVQANIHFLGNSFPSGHTTIAMSLLLALVILVPYRWRGLFMLLFTANAVTMGALTLTAKWHRLSDTLGADCIALGVACLVSWWLARRGAVKIASQGRHWLRLTFMALLLVGAITLTLLAGYLLLSGVKYWPTSPDKNTDWLVFLAFDSLASAASILTALIFWWSWYGLEVQSGK